MAYINGNKILNVMVNGTLSNVDEKVAEAYKEGQQAEYDKFWDSFQQKGKRIEYANGFAGYGWNGGSFYPKYNMKLSTAYMMFRYFDYPNNSLADFDLAARLEECGVTMDTSNVKSGGWQYAFYAAAIKRIPVLIVNSQMNDSFVWCSCQTIDKIVLPATQNNITFARTFDNVARLKNIIFEGLICNDIAFPKAPLTVESMKSIINSLYDYSGTGTTHTLTFKANQENMLTEEEKAVATNKGWTLVWS
jgi:hypothetical protein